LELAVDELDPSDFDSLFEPEESDEDVDVFESLDDSLEVELELVLDELLPRLSVL
jgi:hypothetical protein